MLDLPHRVKIRLLEFMAYSLSGEQPPQPFSDEELLEMFDAESYVMEEKLLLAGRYGGRAETGNWDLGELEPGLIWEESQ